MSALLYASDAVYCGLVYHTSYTTLNSWPDHLEMPENPLVVSRLIPGDSQTSFFLVLFLKAS